MGFFSTKTTHVASTLYNMAGAEVDRPSYLKTVVVGSIVGNSKANIATSLHDSYLKGPGINLRSFYRWAEENYTEVGVPQGNLGRVVSIDSETLAEQIPPVFGRTTKVQTIHTGAFDHAYFAEQWMIENHPTQLTSNWFSDINEATGEITITLANATTHSFTPVADRDGKFIYAVFLRLDDLNGGPPTSGLFIYEIGTGNAVLDAAYQAGQSDGGYIPHIPVRIDNEFVSESYDPDLYDQVKRAYRRGVGGSFDELVTKLEDNEDLDEIDFAYVCFGVPLNVLDNSSREYLYRFFDRCRFYQTAEYPVYASNIAQEKDHNEELRYRMREWTEGETLPEEPPPMEWATLPPRVGTTVHIRSQGLATDTKLDMKITWGAITLTTGTGLKKPGAKKNEYWLEVSEDAPEPEADIFVAGYMLPTTSGEPVHPIMIHWQVDEDNWKTLTIYGMTHENMIYNRKSVVISASEALLDTEESGFLVPMHYPTVREMSLVSSTQMMTAGTYLVLNSYKIVKKKWYETGFFKIVVLVAIIAITIATQGAGAALVPGILGTAGAVGAAIGLTGLAAIIAGTIINALAAIIISQLIMTGATMLLGDKWGALVGAIVSFIALNVAASFSSGASMAQMFNSMTSAVNLIQMTNAVTGGITGMISASTMETIKETQDAIKRSERELKNLTEQFAREFGYDRAMLNPMGLTDTPFGNFVESEEDFLSRTLLTGSDIAEVSHEMINNFAYHTLRLDLRPF